MRSARSALRSNSGTICRMAIRSCSSSGSTVASLRCPMMSPVSFVAAAIDLAVVLDDAVCPFDVLVQERRGGPAQALDHGREQHQYGAIDARAKLARRTGRNHGVHGTALLPPPTSQLVVGNAGLGGSSGQGDGPSFRPGHQPGVFGQARPCGIGVPGASTAARRRSSSVASTKTSIRRLGTSTRTRSPSATKAMGPPSTASGAMWPTQKPCVPPLKRPSVMSAQSPLGPPLSWPPSPPASPASRGRP